MKDKTIYGCSVDRYIETIKSLKPNYFLTLDGETYEGETNLAKFEMERIYSESKEIIKKCCDSNPIGLVKGSNLNQIIEYTRNLNNIGINDKAFHIGDFLYRGAYNKIGKAKIYVNAIKKMSNSLMLYGIGSRKYFKMFYNADLYATQSHIINAINVRKIKHGRSHRYSYKNFTDIRKIRDDLVGPNLKDLDTILNNELRG